MAIYWVHGYNGTIHFPVQEIPMLTSWLPDFVDAAFLRNALVSLIFFLILMAIRFIIRRALLRHDDIETEIRQRWLATLRESAFRPSRHDRCMRPW